MARHGILLLLPLLIVSTLATDALPRERVPSTRNVIRDDATSEIPSVAPRGVFSAAAVDTTWFGGTAWDATDMRWEGLQDSLWTFDSGVGSHFNHSDPDVDPTKDLSLHTYMEGWLGVDGSSLPIGEFRRLSTTDPNWGSSAVCVGDPAFGTGVGGTWSMWAGLMETEALAAEFDAGQGYGNDWSICIGKTYSDFPGGALTLIYDYVNETEPGFDFTRVYVDGAQVAVYDGFTSGQALINTTGEAGALDIAFCVSSDGAWSDEDALYSTNCGAFAVDNIGVSAPGYARTTDFESDEDGWAVFTPPGIGEFSNIEHRDDALSWNPMSFPCDCGVQDSALVFHDLSGLHPLDQDNFAASPWIELTPTQGDQPGRVIEFDVLADLPLTNRIFYTVSAQWYDGVSTSQWTGNGFVNYRPQHCARQTMDFSQVIPTGVERVRIALGVVNWCSNFGDCTGITNSTPLFDNVRFGVFGESGAPLVASRTVSQPQDSFPQDGTLSWTSPGRVDCNSLQGSGGPDPGTSLGDTLVCDVAGDDVQVEVVFAVDPGPAIVGSGTFTSWLTSHQFETSAWGLDWYSARMDTAEIAGNPVAGRWMTTYHETDPNFSGPDDQTDPGDLDPYGRQTRLLNEIFRDDLFTPGTRILLFYKAGFESTGPSVWSTFPRDTTGLNVLEMEILPSSMKSDGTFNSVLLVNQRNALPDAIEHGLDNVLLGTSENFEQVGWDRFDIEAPSSLQGTFGRPSGSQYGATVTQMLGYKAIIWDTGNLGGFALQPVDTQNLVSWLSDSGMQGLYMTGDNLAFDSGSIDPIFLNSYLGITGLCDVSRVANCPVGSLEDTTACIGLVAGGAPHFSPSASMVVQGNGCPQNRSLDVVGIHTDAITFGGDPRINLQFDSSGNGGHSVSNDNSTIPFKTVFDGSSLGYMRSSDCEDEYGLEARLRDVLGWFGCLTDTDGDLVPDIADACPSVGPATGEVDRDFDGCPEPASSFRFVKYWSPERMPVLYETDAVGDPGITDDSEFTALANAFATWTAVSGVQVSGGDDGTRAGPSVVSTLDHRNSITFSDPAGFLPGVLAITPTTSVMAETTLFGHRFRPGEIVEFEMMFNTSQFEFATPSSPGSGSAYNLQALATHEFGHAFGFSHTFIPEATMFYVVPQGPEAETLESDDTVLARRGYATGEPTLTVEGHVFRPDGTTPIVGAAVYAVSETGGNILQFTPTGMDGTYKLYELIDDFKIFIHPLDGTPPLSGLNAASINADLAAMVETDFLPEAYDGGSETNTDFGAPGVVLSPGGGPYLAADIIANTDLTPPMVVQTTPVSGTVDVSATTAIAIKFNERMNTEYFGSNPDVSFRDLDADVGLGGSAAFVQDDSLLVFTPSAPLDYLTNYRFIVGPDLRDLTGNQMAAPESVSFTVEAQPPVALVSMSPGAAPEGAALVILGEGFDPDPAGNLVHFGGGISLNPDQATPDRVFLTVPEGALSGDITVEVGINTSNALPLEVLPPKDPPTGNFLGEAALGGTPRKLSVKGNGEAVFVAHDQGVSVVDPLPTSGSFLSVSEIPIPGGCTDLVCLPAGDRLVVVGPDQPRIKVVDVDPMSGTYLTVLEETSLLDPPLAMAGVPGGAEVIVTYTRRAVLHSVQAGDLGQELKTWSSPDYDFEGDVGVSPTGEEAYAATSEGRVAILSLITGESIAGTLTGGPSPREVASTPDAARFLAVDEEGVVRVFGTRGPLLQTPLALGGGFRGFAVSPEGSFAYPVNYIQNRIDILDLQKATVAATGSFPTGVDPVDIGTGGSGRYLFVATAGLGRLEVYDSNVGAQITSVFPPAGGTGTLITIAGSGFDAVPANNTVTIGGVAHVPVRVGAGESYLVVAQDPSVVRGPIMVNSLGLVSNSSPYQVINRPDPGLFTQGATVTTGGPAAEDLLLTREGLVLLALHGDGSIIALDANPRSQGLHGVLASLTSFETGLGGVGAAVLSASGEKLYIHDPVNENVAAFSVDELASVPLQRTGTVHDDLGDLAIPVAAMDASHEGEILLVLDAVTGELHEVMTDADSVTATIGGFVGPVQVTVHPEGHLAYVADASSGNGSFPAAIRVVDLDPDSGTYHTILGAPFALGLTETADVLHTHDGRLALCDASGEIREYTTQDSSPYLTAGGSLSTGSAGIRLAANRSGTLLFAVVPGEARVRTIDLGSFSLLAEEWTAPAIGGAAAVSLDDARLYLPVAGDLAVVDLTPVSQITLFSGGNQNGVSGQPLGAMITARLKSSGFASLLAGSPVTFSTSSDGVFGSSSPFHAVADERGVVSASYSPGTTPGSETISIQCAAGVVMTTVSVLGDTASTPPLLIAVSPDSGATNLGVNTAIAADFSKAMDPATVGPGTFIVTPFGGSPLTGTYSFANSQRRVVFRAAEALLDDTEYTVDLTAGLTDQGAMPLSNPGTSSFHTAPAPPPNLAAMDAPAARIADRIVIAGAGFSRVPSENQIQFSGVNTYPVEADPNSLVTLVPSGAVTGPVQILVNGVPSNPADFTVLVPTTQPTNDVVTQTEVPSSGQDIAVLPDGSRAYVTLPNANVVVPLRRESGTMVVEEAIPVGIYPFGVVAAPDGKRVFVTNFFSNDVAVVDTDPLSSTFHEAVAFIPTGNNPSDLAPNPNDRDLYVLNYGDQTLSIVDVNTESATAYSARSSVNTESSNKGVTVTPDGGRIIVGTTTGLLIIQADDIAARTSINTESSTKGVTVTPDGGLAVVLTVDNYLLLIDILEGSPTEGQARASINTETSAKGVSVSPDGGFIYVIGEFEVLVYQLKKTSSQVSGASPNRSGSFYAFEFLEGITVGENPTAVAFDPSDGEDLYVVNAGDNTVSLVDTAEEPPQVGVDPDPTRPLRFAFLPVVPNPFRGGTAIRFELPEAERVSLRIFGIDGSLVRELADDTPYPAGRHRLVWNGRNETGRATAAGIYFMRIVAGEHRAVQKMVRLR